MKRICLMLLFGVAMLGQSTPVGSGQSDTKPASHAFAGVADTALAAMTRRAEELRITGVAVVAFIEGDTARSWSSKMVVVGTLTNPPTAANRGNNLLAIAYTKAAEMAETLKDSGRAGRPPMTGETGWEGGLIRKTANGYALAAFSGGPSASDLKVSQAGLDVLLGKP
jgi:hypothetical protein